MRRTAGIASMLALLGLLAYVWTAEARDTALTTDRTATNLSAFGQGLAWSRGLGDGRSQLVLRAFGAPADVSIAPVSGLVDPDLGQDASGGSVAVYTRCSGVSGRNCDIYEYDFVRKRELKVSGASTSRCSEFAPSIWQGTIAFARRGPRGCNGLYVKGPHGAALMLDRRVPADTDIREGKVAYLYAPSAKRTEIRVFSIAQGSSQPVITGLSSGGERTRVSNPTFGGSYVYWLFNDLRRHDFTIGRSRGRASSTLQFADRKFSGSIDSIAVDGRTVYYTNHHGVFVANDPAPRFTARG